MDDSRIPEKVFGGRSGVRRSVGRPRGRWEDVYWWDAVDLLQIRTGWRQEGTGKVEGQISGRPRLENGSKLHKRRKNQKWKRFVHFLQTKPRNWKAVTNLFVSNTTIFYLPYWLLVSVIRQSSGNPHTKFKTGYKIKLLLSFNSKTQQEAPTKKRERERERKKKKTCKPTTRIPWNYSILRYR